MTLRCEALATVGQPMKRSPSGPLARSLNSATSRKSVARARSIIPKEMTRDARRVTNIKKDYMKHKNREEYGERAEHREREAYGKHAGRGLREEPYEPKERGDSYDRDDDCERHIMCIASYAWPDRYWRMLDERVGIVARGSNRTVEFRFPGRVGDVTRVFLLLRYTVEGRCDPLDKPLSRQLC